MASSLLTLIDDIATLLDDVAVMSKVALRKTAGVLGDDLALNAQQVAGVKADRELPVVWAVAKGSMINKAILVPVALIISAIAPWAITPLLMLGGLFLCYEGAHKLLHHFFHKADKHREHERLLEAIGNDAVDMVAFEKNKIKGAIRTDFILSAEIIVITLGTVADLEFSVRVATLIVIAIGITVGVYGLVGAIVKLDDGGLHLAQSEGSGTWPDFKRLLGRGVLGFAPWLMKTLSVVGTAAMFLVGGGIISHGFHWIYEHIQRTAGSVRDIPAVGDLLASLTAIGLDALVGIAAGLIVVGLVTLGKRITGHAH